MDADRRDRSSDGRRSARFKGWMVLATLVAFFGTIFVANGSLVYYALSTFSGDRRRDPYEHGLAYDKDIAAAQRAGRARLEESVGADLRPGAGVIASPSQRERTRPDSRSRGPSTRASRSSRPDEARPATVVGGRAGR